MVKHIERSISTILKRYDSINYYYFMFKIANSKFFAKLMHQNAPCTNIKNGILYKIDLGDLSKVIYKDRSTRQLDENDSNQISG